MHEKHTLLQAVEVIRPRWSCKCLVERVDLVPFRLMVNNVEVAGNKDCYSRLVCNASMMFQRH